MRIVIFSILFFIPAFSGNALEASIIQEVDTTHRVEVTKIYSEEERDVPNTNTKAKYQSFQVTFLDGTMKGKTVTLDEGGFNVAVGDIFYLRYLKTNDGQEYFSLQEPYRFPALITLIVFFIILVLLLGGKHGFLSLVSLFISFGVIFKFLFPELLSGANVIFVATSIALLSLFVVMYVTHGFTRLTTSAFLGSSGAVLVTVVLAKYAVAMTSLTGYAEEESVYLNLATGGSLDFVALLIGGIIIGVIGVVDDVAITQASIVNELRQANKNLSRFEVYTKALKVGKDHIGAVVNTLILAYTGASLPLVLLLYTSTSPFIELFNREAIAVEVVRSVVGSIGLLLVMPLTTAIAVWLMYRNGSNDAHTHHHHH
ncbi:MAG: hypothetical protein QG653_25 [Patescibacteria group bacterium]|nr:hypothetical protein [Patescibacteria group bacterium]